MNINVEINVEKSERAKATMSTFVVNSFTDAKVMS